MGGQGDPEIAEVCRVEERALVTLDLDFADILAYPPEKYSGIIVLRLTVQDVASVLRALRRFDAHLQQEVLAKRLWIVEDSRIRIRGES